MAGTLFVVATPIGNLEDLTFRALRTLKEVDLIAAEDTRRTGKLLAHYEIRKPVISVREHNEAREATRLVARLSRGESVALVTDAGTPGIADPGAKVVAAAREAGISVVAVPGASAITAALSASGLSGTEFVFMGFPPSSGSARSDWMSRLSREERTVVFFEAPHRINRTLGEMIEMSSNIELLVFRELTKIHESLVVMPTNESPTSLIEQGEFVVVVGSTGKLPEPEIDAAGAEALIGRLTNLAGVDAEMAVEMVGHTIGVEATKLKKAIKKHRISVNRQIESSS